MVKAGDLSTLDEERVERKALLSYGSTERASCFGVFVCLSF